MNNIRQLFRALLIAGLLNLQAHAATGDSVEAVAYQQNPAHTGSTLMGTFAPPLKTLWTVTCPGAVSYPLVAGGKVFITTSKTSGSGTALLALNAETGAVAWGPLDLGGSGAFSALAYENGRIFALNYNGLLAAFNANTGGRIWSRVLTGQYSFTAPPTALNGRVYAGGAGSGGTLYAVSAQSGALLWTAPVANGDKSAPTVTDTGVYVSYAGGQTYEFSPALGELLWHYDSGFSGGGGKTSVYYQGGLFIRDFSSGNLVFNGATGKILGSYSASVIPALSGDLAFTLNGGTLEGLELKTGRILWSFAGDGGLVTAPFVINDTVYVGSSSGKLYGLNQRKGSVLWSINVGTAFQRPDEQNSIILSGFAAGGNKLFVVSGGKLTALGKK